MIDEYAIQAGQTQMLRFAPLGELIRQPSRLGRLARPHSEDGCPMFTAPRRTAIVSKFSHFRARTRIAPRPPDRRRSLRGTVRVAAVKRSKCLELAFEAAHLEGRFWSIGERGTRVVGGG